MPEVLLGFGGNFGDVPAAITHAVSELRGRGFDIQAVSRFYRTAPWGGVPQPDFINACARGQTGLAPQDLLAVTQALEREAGRVESERWGPRALDIDLLAYGDCTLNTPQLTVPHPRLTERAFVLVPLAEIAPDWVIAGRSVSEWLVPVATDGIQLVGADPIPPK